MGTAAPARLGGRVVPDETLPLGVGLPPGGSPSAPITFGTMAHAAIWAEPESAPQRGTAGRFRLLEAPVVPSGLTDPPSGAAELSVIMQAGLAPLARRVLGCSEEVSLVQPWVDADLSEMTTLPAGEGLSRDSRDPAGAGVDALEEDSPNPPELRAPLLPRILLDPCCSGAGEEGLASHPQRVAAAADGPVEEDAAAAAGVRERAEALLLEDLFCTDAAALEPPVMPPWSSDASVQAIVWTFEVSQLSAARTKSLLDWSPITSNTFRTGPATEVLLREDHDLVPPREAPSAGPAAAPMSGADALRLCVTPILGAAAGGISPASDMQLSPPAPAGVSGDARPAQLGRGEERTSTGDLHFFRAAHAEPVGHFGAGVSIPGHFSLVSVPVAGTPLDLLQKMQCDHNMLLAQAPKLMSGPLGDGFIEKRAMEALGHEVPPAEGPERLIAAACAVLRQAALGMLEYGIRFAHLCVLHQLEVNPELLGALNSSKNGTLRQLAAAFESVEGGALVDTGKLAELKRLVATFHTLQVKSKILLIAETEGAFTLIPAVSSTGARFTLMEPEGFAEVCEPESLEPFLCSVDVVVVPPEIFQGPGGRSRCQPLLRMCTHVIQFCSTDDSAPGTDDIAQSALTSDCAVYCIQSVCKGDTMRLHSREVAKMFLMLGGGAEEGASPGAAAPPGPPPPPEGTPQGAPANGEDTPFREERGAGFAHFEDDGGAAWPKAMPDELPSPPRLPRGAAPNPAPSLSLDMAVPLDDHNVGGELWTSGLAGAAFRTTRGAAGFGPPRPLERDQGAARGAGLSAFGPEWQTPSAGALHHGAQGVTAQMAAGGWNQGPRAERDRTFAARRQLEASGFKRRRSEPDKASHGHTFEKFRLVDRAAEMKHKLGVYGGNGGRGGNGTRLTSYSLSVAAGARKPVPRHESGRHGQYRSPGEPASRGLGFWDNRDLSLAERHRTQRAAQNVPGAGLSHAGGLTSPMAAAPAEPKPRWELASRQPASGAQLHTEGGLTAEFPMPEQLGTMAEAIRFEEYPDGTHCFSYDGVYKEAGHRAAPGRQPDDCFRRLGDRRYFGAQPGVAPADSPCATTGNAAAERLLGPQARRLHSGSLPPAKHEAGARRVGRARFQR